ncbi:MAG: hypothetical protein AB1540_10485 [Bdellovibrionota bacterium]
MLVIKQLLPMLLTVLAPQLGLAESEYMKAYAKAYREYTRRVDEAHQAKKPLSVDERAALHKELFADSYKAYASEVRQTEKQVATIAKDYMKKIAQKKNKLSKMRSSLAIEGDQEEELAEKGPAAAEPDAAGPKKEPDRALGSSTASADAKPPSAKPADAQANTGQGPVKPGAAEEVFFTRRGIFDGQEAQAPAKSPDVNEAGAEELHFH